VKFQAVRDHSLLAGEAAVLVLFVGFLESIEGQVSPVLWSFLQGCFIRLLGFFAGGTCENDGAAEKKNKTRSRE
jgi:hypothetical protein